MSALIRPTVAVAVLLILSACQITGAAAPSSQDKGPGVEIGSPGSGAP